MLPEQETLLTIAEIAISLIGVSGIVAVFLTQKPIDGLSSARFLVIVATGSMVAFLAFVPIWLARQLPQDANVWQSAAIVALVTTVLANLVVGRFTHTTLGQVSQSFAGDAWSARVGAAVLSFIVVALLALNIFSWPVASNGTAYELMLFVGIVQMAVAFATLVLGKVDDPKERFED